VRDRTTARSDGSVRMKPSLLIPVENQVRELDPKLLLACVAARRGYECVVGSRRDVELSIGDYPYAIFLSKSMTIRSLLMFYVTRRLGHEIITWDEEALVHLPPDMYYPRRLHPLALRFVSRLLAWGEDNAELWRRYPRLPKGLAIRVTGNPRSDLLRPDIRRFYAPDVAAIREQHGNFILVNTNFNHVNAFFPKLNVFEPPKEPGGQPKFARGGRGMSREFAEALYRHKKAILDAFLEMIPELAAAFPDHKVVVRPHPTEKHDVYKALAASHPNVVVTNAGNVVPWLLAAKVLVHNGCTTGVEAFAIGMPAISYRPHIDERIDTDFYRLPNELSYQCLTLEEVRQAVGAALIGRLGGADGEERKQLFDHCVVDLQGETASSRIVDVVEEVAMHYAAKEPGSLVSVERGVLRKVLKIVARYHGLLPGAQNKPEFQRHRYPGNTLEEMRERVARWQAVLEDPAPLVTNQVADHIFRITDH